MAYNMSRTINVTGRRLVVLAKPLSADTRTTDPHVTREYWIQEWWGGALHWRWVDARADVPQSDPRVLALRNFGFLDYGAVTPEEAEAITGLHAPAALDRLRELLHESEAV